MAEPTKDELRGELEAMRKELARLKRNATGAPARGKPVIQPVVPDDIGEKDIRDKLDQALEVAAGFDDSAEAREPLAKRAQDLVIALRELNVGYSARAVSLIPNPSFATKTLADGSRPKGDLYINGTPCHPRAAAEQLAAFDVDELTALCSELEAKLDYEATP